MPPKIFPFAPTTPHPNVCLIASTTPEPPPLHDQLGHPTTRTTPTPPEEPTLPPLETPSPSPLTESTPPPNQSPPPESPTSPGVDVDSVDSGGRFRVEGTNGAKEQTLRGRVVGAQSPPIFFLKRRKNYMCVEARSSLKGGKIGLN